MPRTAAQTGIMPTALVAIEQSFPPAQRIVDDGFAQRMLPLGGRIFVGLLRPRWMREWLIRASEKSNPGIWGGMLCRKRYIDERLLASRNDVEALVNLGAGLDTRAYRLPGISSLPVWEIDQRVNIDLKAARLRTILGTIPPNIHLVPVNFDREDLGTSLARAAYSLSKKTFFLCEAVTQYLTEQGVRATFDFLAQAASGSRLTFTYVRKDFLEGRALYGWPNGYKQFVATKLWQFGLMPEACSGFLAPYGWRVIEHFGYDELATSYLKPTGRTLSLTPVERMVYAEKT